MNKTKKVMLTLVMLMSFVSIGLSAEAFECSASINCGNGSVSCKGNESCSRSSSPGFESVTCDGTTVSC